MRCVVKRPLPTGDVCAKNIGKADGDVEYIVLLLLMLNISEMTIFKKSQQKQVLV